MRKYAYVLNIGIQNTLVYRVNFLFRSTFALVPLLATIYLWRAVFHSRGAEPEVGGYSLAAMTSYYLLVTLVDALTAVTDDDWQIASDIKDGNISHFLLKPIDFLAYRLCLYASGRVIYCAVAALPLAVFVICLRQYFVWPNGWGTFGLFVISVMLTALLQFFMSYTMALLAFWVLEVSTFIFIVFAFEQVAGGHLFPLDILPPFWARLLEFTPFPYLLYFPVGVYLGRTTGAAVWQGLAIQAGWVFFFYWVARWVWSRGIRHYTAVGG